MIQVFKTDEEYVKWLDGQTLPSGIVVYVSDDETMYFSTNNIKGELKTYKCKKEEPIQYPPLIYSTNAAGSTITVNGQSMTLGQGDNITLEYPTAITSVKATNNTALTTIQIPNTVVSINDNAFTGCTALTDFNFNGTKAQWGAITLGTDWNKDAAFTVVHCTDGDVSLEEPIQPIQPNNLVYSTNAAGSTIKVNGETVTLGQGENIVLDYPTAITSVKATSNTALTYIQIPNTVASIEDGDTSSDGAFANCTALASVTLPDSLTLIGAYTFYNCTALASITIPNSVTTIQGYTFYNCTSLTSVTLHEGVTRISIEAFRNCSSLRSINIPDTITDIGTAAFRNCSSLRSINIPDGIKNIYDYTFNGCSSLTSITIPTIMRNISTKAFADCTKLNDFNYSGTMEYWSYVAKASTWKDNTPFTVVHCSDGDVTV